MRKIFFSMCILYISFLALKLSGIAIFISKFDLLLNVFIDYYFLIIMGLYVYVTTRKHRYFDDILMIVVIYSSIITKIHDYFLGIILISLLMCFFYILPIIFKIYSKMIVLYFVLFSIIIMPTIWARSILEIDTKTEYNNEYFVVERGFLRNTDKYTYEKLFLNVYKLIDRRSSY